MPDVDPTTDSTTRDELRVELERWKAEALAARERRALAYARLLRDLSQPSLPS